MAKTTFLTCVAVFCSLPFFAQRTDTFNLDYELFKRKMNWNLSGGGRFSHYDFNAMNRAIEKAGLPGLDNDAYGGMVAFRGSSEKTRWAGESAFEFQWANSNNGQAVNGSAVTYRDYALFFRLMYDVSYHQHMTKVYPFAGFGVAYRVLRTYSGIPGSGNFALTVNQGVRRYRFDCSSIPLEIGLGLEQGFRGKRNDIFIGIRGGYTFHTLQGDWALDGDVVTDLPKPATAAPFAALFLRIKADPKRTWALYKARMKKG